jgi:PAS domain S-box-containing protein
MTKQTPTNGQHSGEIAALRRRVAELEALEIERRRGEQIQSALYRIADAASAATDMPEFYAAMHRIVGELMYADYFYIALYDEARQMINYPFYRDTVDSESWPAAQVWLPMGAEWARGMTAYVLRTGQPALITPEVSAELIRQGEIEHQGVPAVDWLGVPLKTEGQTLGAVVVQSYSEDIRYTEQDKELLAFVAQHIATALSRARAIDETRQRNDELAIINSVQQGLAAQRDFQVIIDLVGERVRAIFDASNIWIALYDRQHNLIRFPYNISRGERVAVEPREPGQGLISILIQSGQPLVLDTWVQQLQLGAIPDPADIEQAPAESWLGVPIIACDDLIGAMSVHRLEQHAFAESDVSLLSTLASSMAVALENARLFDETRRLLAETEQRAAELETVNRIGQALASELELDALIQLTGEQVRQTFAADIVYVGLHDQATGMIDFPYEFGDSPASIRFGEGLSSRIITTGEPLLINEAVDERHSQLGAVPVGIQAKSYLGVPICVRKQTIGLISVQSTQHEGRFSEDDVRLLSTIAASVGGAICNAQLYQETQRRAREMAALAEVGREISASLDLPTVLERIAARALELLHGRDVVLRLLEPDGNLPAVVALGKYAEIYKAWQVQLGYGLTGKIAQSGVAEIVNDPLDDPRVVHIAGTEEDDATEAMIFAPLLTRENVIGVMTVWRDKTVSGPFAQSDLDFVVGLARQAAIAIENARLFAEIQQQKQFSDALIEASPVAIILNDLNEYVTAWNAAAETLFGYTRAEAVGRHLADLVANRPDIRQDADRYTLTTPATYQGTGHHGIGRRTRKDGQLVDVEFFSVAINMGGQDVAGIVIYHDITELQKARQEAIDANQAKSAFLANMSHELRTPLNAIIGFSRIVRRKAQGTLPDKQLDNLDKVLTSADQLLGLINTILDIAKIEAGRMDVQLVSFSPAALVDMCLTTAQPLLRPDVALAKDITPDLPPIFSDQDKVKQILLNLLSNAAKFTHAGTITLRVRTKNQEPRTTVGDAVLGRVPSGWFSVLFEVTDTGIGIAEEALSRIFEEFQQADTSTTRQYGGTGLGLSISRHLARLLGGDLTATSSLGTGSTFTLTIPVHYRAQPAPAVATRPDDLAPEPASTPFGQPIILTIDDDPDAIELIQENLADAGYRVVAARSGDEGVQKAKELRPYAITLDIMMPNKDGWQVLHDLKNDPVTRDIPVILLTIVDKKALGYQLGAADYLVKPLDREALLVALGRTDHANGAIAPKRLLVVDDDPNVIEMIEQLLSETAYEVDVAADGVAALEAIARQRPDAILLDLVMPQLDGFGLIEQLRQRPDYAAIPIIVLTAKTLSNPEAARLRASVAQVIQKQGMEENALIRELQRALQPAKIPSDVL